MPFDLIKGGKWAYDPMQHGFSQREIKDTIRRMEVLMKDLELLAVRKENEIKRLGELPKIVDWVGRDATKDRQREHHEHACWAGLDRGGIEAELPIIEEALEHAPEETPPLRHEDYYQRCKNLKARRGEYWRINPTYLKSFSAFSVGGRKGIGLPTPEKEKYWPTHQVPWEQDKPPPSPTLKPPTPPPPPPPETPKRRPRRHRPMSPWMNVPWSGGKRLPWYERDSDTSPSLSISLSPPDMSPYPGDEDDDWCLPRPRACPPPPPECVPQNLTPPPAQACPCPSQPNVQEECLPGDSASSLTPQSSASESIGCLDEDMFQGAFSPEIVGEQEMEVEEDADSSIGCLDEDMFQGAFSPEIVGEQEMEIMMDDAVQRCEAAEVLDPCQIECQAFSPERIDDDELQTMLSGPGPEYSKMLTATAQEGLKEMSREVADPMLIRKHGFGREQQWKDRCARWKEEGQRQYESAQARQMDAAALFGIRSRGCLAATPERPPPETVPWGESPIDRVTPSPPPQPRASPRSSVKGKGKRLVRPKVARLPSPDLKETPPIRFLCECPGPTPTHPRRPSTSNCIYNTRRGRYEYLDKWQDISEEKLKAFKSKYWFKHLNRWADRIFKRGGFPKPPPPPPSPECGPEPEHMSVYVRELTPPPTPECGPEPEHMSVYVPERVDESPDTFVQSVHDARDRFERKLLQVKQKIKRRNRDFEKYREESPWVAEEYKPRISRWQKEAEQERREEIEAREKWDTYMLCRLGTVPTPDRYGSMKGTRIRTASTYRPKISPLSPKKKPPPVNVPYDEPLYGPWLPWVYGSHRPPPRTAAGRISSPCEPAPKPPVRRPVDTPPPVCPVSTPPPQQPAQVQYGSTRRPPKTAASYKYQATPPGRTPCRAAPRRRLLPGTPEALYGSRRPAPRTASCARPATPVGRGRGRPQ